MRWVKKTGVKLYRLSFSIDRSSGRSQVFRLDPPVGKLSRKKLSGKKSPFSCKKARFGLQSKTADCTVYTVLCIRNGLGNESL